MTHGLGESKVKVVINHPLPALQGRELVLTGVKSRLVRVVNLYTPAGLLIFRKAVSAVMDDLGTDVEIIENYNLILKLGSTSA